MESIHPEYVRTQSLNDLYHGIEVDVLRLDLIHPVVSGNKWYKLRYYVDRVVKEKLSGIITFGGAYSNHIIATAYACNEMKVPCIGIIRGERPAQLSHTLEQALNAGMSLHFISRDSYRERVLPPDLQISGDWLNVGEGGYGPEGVKGARDILGYVSKDYDHIICGVGTGTTLAGLASGRIDCIGIPVVKNDHSLNSKIENLNPDARYVLVTDYHFGGYAKFDDTLIDFMNHWYNLTSIPTDFVYTGKVFYAMDHLVRTGYFKNAKKLLVIHTGGLQGNDSLPKGTLIF